MPKVRQAVIIVTMYAAYWMNMPMRITYAICLLLHVMFWRIQNITQMFIKRIISAFRMEVKRKVSWKYKISWHFSFVWIENKNRTISNLRCINMDTKRAGTILFLLRYSTKDYKSMLNAILSVWSILRNNLHRMYTLFSGPSPL